MMSIGIPDPQKGSLTRRLAGLFYNLTISEADRQADNFMEQDFMINEVIINLLRHNVFAEFVDSYANVGLWRGETYEVFHCAYIKKELSNDPSPAEPRTVFIAGPILSISSITGCSIAVELSREGLLELDCSSYVQPTDYHIAGWREAERTGQPKGSVNEDVHVIYASHTPLQDASKRERHSVKGNRRNNPELVDKAKNNLALLLSSNDVARISNESDLGRFLFLNQDEIDAWQSYASSRYGKKVFSGDGDECKQISFARIMEDLDVLHITPHKYPDSFSAKQ